MTRRKREIVGLTNERDFPHLVELALPPGGFRSVFLEIDAFHRERRIPVRRGRSRHEAEPRGRATLYSILLPRDCHCGCIPQSLRWRVLDLSGIVGCTRRSSARPRKIGAKRNGDNAGQEPVCVWHGRTGHPADRRASSSRSMQKVRRTSVNIFTTVCSEPPTLITRTLTA